MAEPVVISWNTTNWITIFLMAFLGFALLGFAVKWWNDRRQAAQG